MKAVVLTYHSHRVLGPDYSANDHAALPVDLATIARAGGRIVSLATLVDAIEAHQSGLRAGNQDATMVALTFDDGPVWDFADFVHPLFGPQRSFANAMQDFRSTEAGSAQLEVCATSFVIASPEARRAMETTFDRRYTYLEAGSLDDAWWSQAIAGGLVAIGNHSWDHLHPGLDVVAHSRQVRGDFTQVTSVADADAQIRGAMRYIDAHTGGRAAPFFAYPYGHCNEFLSADYLPGEGPDIGLRAAFTTEPRSIAGTENIWRLPRYTCGHHWRSPEELERIVAAA
ncbi:MAG TPA: polysaccharide deacetylase family protein [Casimicrobiaceae bacterium]|nr:polysaccharide deacetylase family protein [Casimicrobiaceae bacterium]